MSTAQVVRIHAHGGPEVMQVETLDVGRPGPGEVVLRQSAVGLNFIDVYTRTGLYPAKLPAVLGVEGAGVVEEVGDGVVSVQPGDRVAYSGVAGAYASRRLISADRLLPLPSFVSEADAAALCLKGLTAWMLLFEVRRVQPGETILVWAAAGGVGSVLVPWANALGARVIGVVSSEAKAELARSYGCDEVILSGEDVARRVRDLTSGAGVPVVYDSVGKDSAEASLAALAPRGWFVTFGNASGPVPPVSPLRLNQGGSLTLTRPSLFHFTRTPEELARGAAALWGAVRSGAVKADVRQTFALAEAGRAHTSLEQRATTGATILLP